MRACVKCEGVVLREFVGCYLREVKLCDVDNITLPIGNVGDND